MRELLIALATGGLAGAVAALCGVGGGIILVPAFVYLLAMDQKHAVGTSLAAIILTAIAATVRNQGNAFIDWKIAIPAALASALVAFFAADALKVMSNQWLTRVFAVVLIAVGVNMLLRK